jgi:hydrogenase expression/formation protein HypE
MTRPYILVAGVGMIESPVRISASRARVRDKVILNGPIGDQGTTIMIARGELGLENEIESDTTPLYPLVREILDVAARPSRAEWSFWRPSLAEPE